jgi:acetylornithine deacetylase/succinyl-diaminopimelate desuccinylase-like protein
VHVTPVVRWSLEGMAAALPEPSASTLRALLDPETTDRTLDALGPHARLFDPVLHNTVSPTIVHGGEKVNVIPSEIMLELDGRILPGFTSDDMLAELRSLIGDDIELEITRHDPEEGELDMTLFDTLADILREGDPGAVVVPNVLAGFTDGHHFARLGIQTYGFTPMLMPEGFEYYRTVHAADERIPVEALEFGANAIYKLLQRFG